MNVLSLFSGIGGLELGLERAGMTVVGQVELDPFCRRVLDKHWPEVPKHDDVRTAVEWWESEPRPQVDVVCGGFPCQPFSTAGRQEGTADERWGWPWFYGIVRALRPRYVVVENVAAFLADRDAFAWMLGDLAAGGYDAEWDCVPAAAVGAPHLRDRVFVVAYPQRELVRDEPVAEPRRCGASVAGDDGAHRAVADAEGDGRGPGWPGRPARDGAHRSGLAAQELADADRQPMVWAPVARPERDPWATEPAVGRVADGVPAGMVRPELRALGNAVVPQVAEHIGRLIVAADRELVA